MKKLFTLFLSIFLINTLLAQTSYLIPLGSEKDEGFVSSMSGVLPCQPFVVQLNDQLLSHPIEDSVYTKVCPADLVTFGAEAIFLNNNVNYLQTQSNTQFIWKIDYIAPDTSAILNKTFFQPMIKNYTLRAVDVNGCSSSNVFKGIILVSGTPIISMNPNINATINTPVLVVAGEEENATLLFQPVEIETDFLPLDFSNYDTVILPDGSNICYNDDIWVGSFQENQHLVSVNQLKSIKLNIEHSYLGDLSITLICPNGSSAVLKSFNAGVPIVTGVISNPCSTGGGNVNLGCSYDPNVSSPSYLTPGLGWDYYFKPDATNCFGTGGDTVLYSFTDAYNQTLIGRALTPSTQSPFITTPYTPTNFGSYETLDNLIGCPLNGNWRISVCDHFTLDNGFIFNWGIEFDESLQIDSMSYTVNVDSARWTGQNITSTGLFNASILNNNPGISNYTVTLIDEFGCEYDADFTVNTVLGVNDFDNTQSPIKFYPNPASYFVNGSSTNTEWNNSTIELYDQSGKLLQTVLMTETSIQIDLSNYAVGQYYIKSTNRNNSSHTVKIVVIR